MLEKFEEDLVKNDKGRKENRRGILTICRMQGSIAQTYFMMDQMQYNVARKIYYGLTNAGDDNIDHSKNDTQENKDQTRIYTRQTMVDGIGPEQNILESKYKKNKPEDGVIFEKNESEEEEDDSQHAH